VTSYLTPLLLLTPRFYLLTQFRTETLGHKTGRQARTVSWTNLGEPVTSQAPELIIQVTSTQMPAATSSASSRTQAMSSLSSRPHCRAEWALYGAARPWWTEQRPVSLLLLIYRLGGWALTSLASPLSLAWKNSPACQQPFGKRSDMNSPRAPSPYRSNLTGNYSTTFANFWLLFMTL